MERSYFPKNEVPALMTNLFPSAGEPASDAERYFLERLRTAMVLLKPLEREIITARHGLDDQPPQPLGEIALHHGLSPAETLEVEEQGLAKLRHPAMAHYLRT